MALLAGAIVRLTPEISFLCLLALLPSVFSVAWRLTPSLPGCFQDLLDRQ